MPKFNPHTNPDPELVALFGTLKNKAGLVPMQIKRAFAPYLLDDIAGFDPVQSARLFLRKEAVPVNAEGEIITIEVKEPDAPSGPVAHEVEIPINWADLHQLQLTRLAKQIAGDPTRSISVADAKVIIEDELKRRETHAEKQDAA